MKIRTESRTGNQDIIMFMRQQRNYSLTVSREHFEANCQQ
jgi:hypothetical protein